MEKNHPRNLPKKKKKKGLSRTNPPKNLQKESPTRLKNRQKAAMKNQNLIHSQQ